MLSARRVLLHLLALAGGALTGLAGSFAHPLRLAGLPVGLGIGLLLTAAVLAAVRTASGARSAVGVAALGWCGPVLVLSAPRPEGDLVIPATALGYAWLLGGLVLAAVAVLRRPAGRPTADVGERR